MPLAVIGTVAIDEVETPFGKRDRAFGGSASYFSYAASFFTPVSLVAIIGSDFPSGFRQILEERPIDLTHLESALGKTFFWRGKYQFDMNTAETLETQLNALHDFNPQLHFRKNPDFLFLANIDPTLQLRVLDQAGKPKAKFVACDTMNFWIEKKRTELQHVLARVDAIVVNDGEARQLAEEVSLIRSAQKIHSMGPSKVIIKKGEHGALLFDEGRFFALPAYPLETVFDPTGAGDSFAGAMMGYLAKTGNTEFDNLKKAIAYGAVVASFTVEDFSLDRLRRLDLKQIEERLAIFRKICSF
ncbi:MAG: bifunctional hydroxymethylpyrimidine kinase/phosphomethylpyrimidine kinase [Candidatus Omnitrophica bacterium]|nr:bifunctional hydroxymethylpyrimidine kinase/phosphomethylpyrimidine kinase [Candidatus Omnitrophota bacterium]